MALRNVITMEDPALRKKSRPVTEFNDRIKQLVGDLKDTLSQKEGYGIAAPQVGILRRVIIVIDGEEIIPMINPELLKSEGETGIDEACFSCPGIVGYVIRPQFITVRAYDTDGNEFTRDFSEIAARAVCHEIDHLDGILFVDIATEVYSDTEEYKERRLKGSGEEDKGSPEETQ